MRSNLNSSTELALRVPLVTSKLLWSSFLQVFFAAYPQAHFPQQDIVNIDCANGVRSRIPGVAMKYQCFFATRFLSFHVVDTITISLICLIWNQSWNTRSAGIAVSLAPRFFLCACCGPWRAATSVLNSPKTMIFTKEKKSQIIPKN